MRGNGRLMKVGAHIVGLAAGLALLAACSSLGADQPTTVTVEVNDSGFQTAVVEIVAGQPSRIVLKNTGTVEHQLGITDIPLVTKGSDAAGHSMAGMSGTMAPEMEQLMVHMMAAPGSMTSLDLTPSMAGEYTFRCVIPGHTEQGTLVVK